MQTVKVIIGASYGDEGKGLAADFFGAQASGTGGSINILTNGGPQRGHTVETEDGVKHVFKHFGAASFRGAVSYFAEQFIVNPMEFVREYEELCGLFSAPRAYIHPRCRFTTPWDMLVNQMLQEKRGLHNSCGFGIWETVLRCNRGFGIPFNAFAAMNREDRISFLRQLRDGYFVKRVRELAIAGPGEGPAVFGSDSTAGLQAFFFSDELLFHFEEDFETMRRLCPMRDNGFAGSFQKVLFENAQGLLLDGNAREDAEFTTPSTTGVSRVFRSIESVFQDADVEICYVSRSYLTRHGDGSMENELPSDQLCIALPGIRADMTNVENRFQGILRYGMMDVDSLAERIQNDYSHCGGSTRNHYRPSVMVTHLNEHAGIDTDRLVQRFGTVYLSNGRTHRDVCRDTASIIF